MRKIHARKTAVRVVAPALAQEFLAKEHRQGFTRPVGKHISLGLYLGEELVAVISFSQPRTAAMKRKYSAELLRLAFKSGVRVNGGASKLIRYYILNFSPTDFFTYQDTTGEASDVYELSGMQLVSQAKKKQYLVAPGKTRETAGKKECYSMASVAMRGPDALLGTTLGEVYRADGRRKTNPELFIEELGWHIEETSGDRVYEWVDPNRTYYTYKITATDSEKYYYGVSHVKKANATIEDCRRDGYMGSGGKHAKNKFSNWQKKHWGNLKKEVLGIHSGAPAAFQEEVKLVGDKHRTDPLCLNSTTGGKDGGLRLQFSQLSQRIAHCEHHGLTPHQGDSCVSCAAKRRYSKDTCEIHGVATFTKGGCLPCALRKSILLKQCEVHGETTFKGESCVRCQNSKNVKDKKCSSHGLTKHIGNRCYECIAEEGKGLREGSCEVHGKTAFRGDKCAKCTSKKSFVSERCKHHGVTLHRGGECMTCKNASSVSFMECEIHGEVKTQNGKCVRCESKKMFSKEECPTHGHTTFRKGKCIACASVRLQSIKNCERHGETLHQRDSCCRCVAEKTSHTRDHIKKSVQKPDCEYCLANPLGTS